MFALFKTGIMRLITFSLLLTGLLGLNNTLTQTMTHTHTPTVSHSFSPTDTHTQTGTRTRALSLTPTSCPSRTRVVSVTPTYSRTETPTASRTPTQTHTPTYTSSPLTTLSPTATASPTQSNTLTQTNTRPPAPSQVGSPVYGVPPTTASTQSNDPTVTWVAIGSVMGCLLIVSGIAVTILLINRRGKKPHTFTPTMMTVPTNEFAINPYHSTRSVVSFPPMPVRLPPPPPPPFES
jgi:hypothetical protein